MIKAPQASWKLENQRKTAFWQGVERVFGAIFVSFLIASCAHETSANGHRNSQSKIPVTTIDHSQKFWTGRLSLSVESEPVQRLSGGFELAGTPQIGQLRLLTPLGGIVGELAWLPGSANWSDGNSTHSNANVDTLLISQIGIPLPIAALFAWMAGKAHDEPGWNADLSKHSVGRITITRDPATDPKLPGAQLLIAITQDQSEASRRSASMQ